jgi:hypothetical protein
MNIRTKSWKLSALFACVSLCCIPEVAMAREIHVSVEGDDANVGSSEAPFRTISAAAAVAQPGDTVTVHAGLYRERITPPRGGTSDDMRVVYQAAPGEQVEIRGSEVVTGWEKVKHDTWKASVPNSLFGAYNPFADSIAGDWFDPKGRPHHTGAVYVEGRQLTEAAAREEVLQPAGTTPKWLVNVGDRYLLNLAWFQVEGGGRVDAAAFAENHSTQTAPNEEGGECIGWIDHGDWVVYEDVDFGEDSTEVLLRAASVTQGGSVEVRLDGPEGSLLGTADVPNTGGWQVWRTFTAAIAPTSGHHKVCLVFKGRVDEAVDTDLWFAEVGEESTTIWAQFPNIDPNAALVEVNARPAVFYPEQPGVNYITVRGFTMRHAATQWAPPTAEQIGLIGTHWSKGWIIEGNTISHSRCVGITLGKHGDEFDNTSADTAEGYVLTIERGLARGWSKENIGGHIVRNNTISHCEQAGIVGSLGAIFSTITGNTIHDIHVKRLFTGAEMAGIKIHAAIDCEISDNRIFRTVRGVWLDWMAQGTRVTRNLIYDSIDQDLFMEVNHGPFLIDNNFFLSNNALLDVSEGGAYVHNMIAGALHPHPELNRDTPYHPAHSTEVAGLRRTEGGDNRFFNNLFVGHGLEKYDNSTMENYMGGNVFFKGALAGKAEASPLVLKDADPGLQVTEEEGAVYLELELDAEALKAPRNLVTSERLGKAKIPDLPYVHPDDAPLTVDTDYFGKQRGENPVPGPVEKWESGRLKLWPK